MSNTELGEAALQSIWVQFSDCGQHIRKWSHRAFPEGQQYDAPFVTNECICPKCGIRHGGRDHGDAGF